MSNCKEIKCKWTLSCGSRHNDVPDIFTAFFGMTIEIILGKITVNGELISFNINEEHILNRLKEYMEDKCKFSETLLENIPILLNKLHFHDNLDESLISYIAFENINNNIPTFYLCDCKHN